MEPYVVMNGKNETNGGHDGEKTEVLKPES